MFQVTAPDDNDTYAVVNDTPIERAEDFVIWLKVDDDLNGTEAEYRVEASGKTDTVVWAVISWPEGGVVFCSYLKGSV